MCGHICLEPQLLTCSELDLFRAVLGIFPQGIGRDMKRQDAPLRDSGLSAYGTTGAGLVVQVLDQADLIPRTLP